MYMNGLIQCNDRNIIKLISFPQPQIKPMFFKQSSQKQASMRHRPSRSVKSKDLGKFIFDFDEHQSSQEQQQFDNTKNQQCQSSLTKLRRLKNWRNQNKGQGRIVPNFINSMNQPQDNNYINYDRAVQKTNNKVNKFQIIPQNNIVNVQSIYSEPVQIKSSKKCKNLNDVSCASINPQRNQWLHQFQQCKQNQSSIVFDQCDQNKQKQHVQQQFQQQQQQHMSKSQTIIKKQIFLCNLTNSVPLQLPQRKRTATTRQILFHIDTDEQNNQNIENDQTIRNVNNSNQVHDEQQESQLTTCGNQNPLDIVNIDQKTRKISQELACKIGQFRDWHNIKIFLQTPIPQSVFYIFQIHKYKSFIKTQYLLWLEHGNQMTLFAIAVNDRIYVEKTVFRVQISWSADYARLYKKNDMFLGNLVSDFKRQTYTLYDHKNYLNPNPPQNRILCTIANSINFLHPKLNCQQLYLPIVSNKKVSSIQNNAKTNKNLKKMHKQQQYKSNIIKYWTHNVPTQTVLKLREQFKIVTNTTRNGFVKDQNGEILFFILKMQENRFKVRAGPGITPLQLFSYAVVHLQ